MSIFSPTRPETGGIRWLALAVLAGLSLLAWPSQGLAQPANDFFENAELITGDVGTVFGSNVDATEEASEPKHWQPTSVQASVWYRWVAPSNSLYTFDTVGSDFDTVMGVYVGGSVATLNLVGNNDDTVGLGLQSRVVFSAAAGVEYRIAVDGYDYGGGASQGNIIMNWVAGSPADAPPVLGGEFNFASPAFRATENESFQAGQYQGPVFLPTLNARSIRGALVTVSRTGFPFGRVLVDYTTIDTNNLACGDTNTFDAIPLCDYLPSSGTLVFDDFQMSRSFVVPIFPDGFPEARRNPKQFFVQLSNPRPAPEEELNNPGLIVPSLGLLATVPVTIVHFNSGWFQGTGTNRAVTSTNFNIERSTYAVDERTPSLTVDIILTGRGGNEGGQVDVNVVGSNLKPYPLLPASDYADAFALIQPNTPYTDGQTNINGVQDFTSFVTRLTFAKNASRQSIVIPIADDDRVEFNEDILIFLTPVPGSAAPVGPNNFARATILYDEQPAGAGDREWNPDFVSSTTPRQNAAPGANNVVRAVVVQDDQRTIIGGDFTAYNSVPRNRLARLNFDGSVDLTFVPGTGADEFVSTVVVYPFLSAQPGKILIGGGFTTFNNLQRNGIARLNDDGSVDASFDPGAGANAPIRSIVLLGDGRILVAGEFTVFNNVPRAGVARLNADGSLDETFDPGAGMDGPVYAAAINAAGQVYLAGDFLTVQGELRPRVARLNDDGSLDESFDPGGGPDGPVHALAVQVNGRVIIGGQFSTVDFRPRRNIARLDTVGALDTTFTPGDGANDAIYSLTLDANGKIYAGGRFTAYNGTRRVGLTRLFTNGTVDTSFMDTGYNQYAGLINTFNFQNPNYVNSVALQANGDVMIGGSFTNIGAHMSEQLHFIPRPAIAGQIWNVWTRADKRARFNVARLVGGYTLGPGNASILLSQNTVDENAGRLTLPLQRFDGSLGTLSSTVTSSNGVALAGVDFGGVVGEISWIEDAFPPGFPISIGLTGELSFRIPVFDETSVEGDEVFDLKLVNPVAAITLGGEQVPLGGALGTSLSTVTITDNDFNKGDLVFNAQVYTTNENRAFARVTVIRTNGTTGNVSVRYFTRNDTATAGVDYTATQGTLTFDSGVTSQSFTVPLIDNFIVNADRQFTVVLTNASGGATIPPLRTPVSTATATVRIIDNELSSGKANFVSTTYQTNENAGSAVISLERLGGSSGELSVTVTAIGQTASSGVDFVGITNRVTWVHNDATMKFITVPLLDDLNVEANELVRLGIHSPSIINGTGTQTNATLAILEDDATGVISFSQPIYDVDERGTNVWVTVVREGGRGGTVTVNYLVADDTAQSGVDFILANGSLTFGPGVTSTNFVVTVLNNTDEAPGGVLTATVQLSGAAATGTHTTATLRILDDEYYGDPAGSLDPTFNALAGANDAINSIVLQPDGRLLVGGSFRLFNRVSRTRLARVNGDGSIDNSFDVRQGPNGTVRSILLQPDGRVVVGGQFTQVAGTNRSYIARFLPDGTLDSFFNPGAGADSPVNALAWLNDGGIVVGGGFSSLNGVSRPGIGILNSNGTVRTSFNPGFGVAGTVIAVAVQPDGKILVGGDFQDVGGFTVPYIARLNVDGSVDGTFSAGTGPNGAVRAIQVLPDGSILIGGSFTAVDGTARGRLAKLTSTGALESLFLAAVDGADSDVTALALQYDGKVVVGGAFSRFNGVTRNRITRLNQNGKTDPSINFGLGANDLINTLAIQTDRRILLGGRFTSYDNEPRAYIARIHGGSIAGPGTFQFSTSFYQVGESEGGAVISVLRRGGTATDVTVDYSSVAGTATPNLDYTNVLATATFPEGEVLQQFTVPIVPDALGEQPETVTLSLSNPSAGTVGDIPNATLMIFSDDSGIGFSAPIYNVGEAVAGGQVLIAVVRVGATNELAQVGYRTVSGGGATAGSDYSTTSGLLTFVPGQTLRTFTVPILDDSAIESTESFGVVISNVSSTASLTLDTATVNIIDNEFGPGVVAFTSPAFSVDETNGTATITVERTGGLTGVVSVDYTVVPTTASTNDFQPITGTLNFVDGQQTNVILVTILDDLLVEPVENFVVSLSNPTGGATIGAVSSTSVSIVDTDISTIVAAGATLISESLTNNNRIDPGETVTVALGLRNQGSGNTINLVGQLLSGNGVSNPSGAQTYGVLIAGGGTVAQNFTFTAVGASGDRILATMLLTDAGSTNGFATFGFTIGGEATRNFASTNGTIVINDDGPATPYPAPIIVDNLGGVITRVTVTLSNFSHTFPDDVDVLLVGPGGEKVTLMSDVGGSVPASNVTLTFSDSATNTLPDSGQLFSRTYVPTNYAGLGTADLFPLPAPGIPYTNSGLAILNGTSPNGLWSLYIVDDGQGDVGTLGGWSLRIETTDTVSSSANLALAARAPGVVVVGSEFSYSFTVTNRGPVAAQNTVVVSEMPPGVSFVRANTSVGTLDVIGRTIRWNIGSIPHASSTTVSLTARASSLGTLVSPVSVAATQVDLSPVDNTATVLTAVVSVPTVAITRGNGAVQVSWPGVSGFRLQSSPSLAPGAWTDVNVAPQSVSGSSVVTLPADGQARFYRLRTE